MSTKRTTATEVTAKLNLHLDSPVSMIIMRGHLHKQNIYGRALVPKPLVTDFNAKLRLQWSYIHKTWAIDKWEKVIWSDKMSFTLFTTAERVHVLKTSAQTPSSRQT
ncbi:transposable element Tcb1 transposase [Trichonephila clavipes]|uniref:Transposable element Tcb1 transposase n=1 Tax=Trichonephila clavipes TaxID=2585209 RepID=A0A8X6RHV5_TRICX|nr:transposable element Tcb1 transposase [Trichonephila clavipes]